MTTPALPIRIPWYIAVAIAAEVECDPKTVRRVLEGLPTRPARRDKILYVAEKLGLTTYGGVNQDALRELRRRLVERSREENGSRGGS